MSQVAQEPAGAACDDGMVKLIFPGSSEPLCLPLLKASAGGGTRLRVALERATCAGGPRGHVANQRRRPHS
jgi:hypothetical protein